MLGEAFGDFIALLTDFMSFCSLRSMAEEITSVSPTPGEDFGEDLACSSSARVPSNSARPVYNNIGYAIVLWDCDVRQYWIKLCRTSLRPSKHDSTRLDMQSVILVCVPTRFRDLEHLWNARPQASYWGYKNFSSNVENKYWSDEGLWTNCLFISLYGSVQRVTASIAAEVKVTIAGIPS